MAETRIALVTGGTGGLGLATARRLAADGLRIVVADLDAGQSIAAAASLPGGGHAGMAIDVSSAASIAAVFDRIETEFGPVAVLAHFAGVLGKGGASVGISFPDSEEDDWDFVMRINARGTFLCLREMARRRRAHPVAHGRAIVISSSAAQMGGLQTGAAYSASKAAVLGAMKVAARDLAPFGVTVNAIAPGPIDTKMLAEASGAASGQKYTRLDAIPLGRIGEPDEVAAAASYLVSIGAGFVTGTTLDVNGGLRMHP